MLYKIIMILIIMFFTYCFSTISSFIPAGEKRVYWTEHSLTALYCSTSQPNMLLLWRCNSCIVHSTNKEKVINQKHTIPYVRSFDTAGGGCLMKASELEVEVMKLWEAMLPTMRSPGWWYLWSGGWGSWMWHLTMPALHTMWGAKASSKMSTTTILNSSTNLLSAYKLWLFSATKLHLDSLVIPMIWC